MRSGDRGSVIQLKRWRAAGILAKEFLECIQAMPAPPVVAKNKQVITMSALEREWELRRRQAIKLQRDSE